MRYINLAVWLDQHNCSSWLFGLIKPTHMWNKCLDILWYVAAKTAGKRERINWSLHLQEVIGLMYSKDKLAVRKSFRVVRILNRSPRDCDLSVLGGFSLPLRQYQTGMGCHCQSHFLQFSVSVFGYRRHSYYLNLSSRYYRVSPSMIWSIIN